MTFGSAERRSAGHFACVAAAVSRGMTGGRVCYAPDGDDCVIDAHAPFGLAVARSSLTDRRVRGDEVEANYMLGECAD